MKISINNAGFLEIETHGMGKKLLTVYIRFTKAKTYRTREILPEVFADFDRHGDIVGIEFNRPGEYDIDAMKQVSQKLKLPMLQAIDVSKLPVEAELVTA